MDIGEQPYDDRHNVPPREEFRSARWGEPEISLSIPDAIDAVRQYRLVKPPSFPRFAEAMQVVTDELEARFNAEQAPKAFDSWSTTLDDAVKYLQDSVDRAEVNTRMTSSIRVVLGALRDRTEAEEAPVPMPKHDANYTLDKAIVDTERAVRLNHLGHYTSMVSLVLGALQDRMLSDVKQNVPAEPVPGMISEPVPGTPLDTQSGLRYIAPGGTFAAYWTGEGNGPQLAQTSLLALRVLSAHLSTALDAVTAELELRRK